MTRTVPRPGGLQHSSDPGRRAGLARGAAMRAAAALLLPMLLLAGCSGASDDGDASGSTSASAGSDGGSGAVAGSDDGGASSTDDPGANGGAGEGLGDDPASDGPSADDGATGGDASANVDQEPYAVTPAPDGFEGPSDSCTGEGAYYVRVGETAEPALPERDGEALTIGASGIDDGSALLTAAVGDGAPRDVEAASVGTTVTIESWTISVTSVCADSAQIEFDLVD
ncbi:hypothetical protein ACXET9_11370 [Brachybacterium sp. DNPG3]